MEKKFIVSVDLGGTKILAAVLSRTGEIMARSKVATDISKGRAFLIKRMAECINSVIETAGLGIDDIHAICVGVPGSVNPYKGTIGTAPNLGIINFNIKKALEKHFTIPILIENDVNLAALGIKEFELKDSNKNILVVFIGTGIGSALIFDGKIYRGSNYFAGEIGHMHVQEKGPICGCGKRGCFEAVAGRLAIVRDIKKDLKTDAKNSILKKIVDDKKPIKSKSLALAVNKKDTIAIKHLTNASKVIGLTLANITNLLNLDLIILGGGVIEALDKFMIPKIKANFDKIVLNDASKSLKIISTKLGDDAALFGGIALAEEFKII